MVQPSKGTGKQTQRGARGSQQKVLVGVRVPVDFHRRIQSELLRRDLTLQEMVVKALTRFFKTPVVYDYEATTYVRHPDKLSEEEVARRNTWQGLWTKYIGLMPREKIEVQVGSMEWDMRALKSSRRKPTWKPVAPKGKG